MRNLDAQFKLSPAHRRAFEEFLYPEQGAHRRLDSIGPLIQKRKAAHTQAVLTQAFRQRIATAPESAQAVGDWRAARGNPASQTFWSKVGASDKYVKFNLNHGEELHVSVWVPFERSVFLDNSEMPGRIIPGLKSMWRRYDPTQGMLDPEGDKIVLPSHRILTYHHSPVILGVGRQGINFLDMLRQGLTRQGMPRRYLWGNDRNTVSGAVSGSTPGPLISADEFAGLHETKVPISKIQFAADFEAPIGHRRYPDYVQTQIPPGPILHSERSWTNAYVPHLETEPFMSGPENIHILRSDNRSVPVHTPDGKKYRASRPVPLTVDEAPAVAEERAQRLIGGARGTKPWWGK